MAVVIQSWDQRVAPSANYPRTYPQDVLCTWRLRVPQGRTLRLLLGDFDIEGSVTCTNGSLVITSSNGSPSIGKHTHTLRVSEVICCLTVLHMHMRC